MYDIRIVTILTANDDGSQAATPTPAAIATSVDLANQVYNPHRVNFEFDPATDVYRFSDDLLNRDSRRRDHEVYTDRNVDPGSDPAFEGDLFNKRRNEVALRFPGRITIYFTTGSRYFWSELENRWIYGPRGYSWSNHIDEFVSMAAHAAGDNVMAHEIGHYLHLPHTFYNTPKTIADAVALIKKFVEVDNGSKDAVLNLFEGDGITDTPPDPGPQLFANQCDPAETTVSIPVTFSDGSKRTYTLTPDRENIMNYWDKTCRGGLPRISGGQESRVFDALHNGNRRHLVDPAVLYFGSFGEGDRSQTRAISWALGDFAKRFDQELKAGPAAYSRRRTISAATRSATMAPGSAPTASSRPAQSRGRSTISQRFNDELPAGRRCVHMQAYDIGGGQIRWDGVWESGGDGGQSWAIGWTLQDFAKRFNDEIADGKRCVQMQAYDLGGGQIRYDGVCEKTDGVQQTRAISWAINDFAQRFNDELQAGRRCVHMQAYDIGGGQIRWDGVWESGGDRGQSRAIGWAFNDFVRRWDQEAATGRRLVRMQAYDLGAGNLRFDGIWETAPGPQRRVVGMTLATFADHFDELTSSGWHVEHMSACLRTYPNLPEAAQSASGLAAANRAVSFGSDFDRRPATLATLPIPPLSGRDPGCDLGR